LEDLEEFINFTKLSAALTPYNPETAEDPEESWAESQIGMPLPEGKFVILELADQFLEENDEPSEDEDEEDGEES
jgi:hypothetical protein